MSEIPAFDLGLGITNRFQLPSLSLLVSAPVQCSGELYWKTSQHKIFHLAVDLEISKQIRQEHFFEYLTTQEIAFEHENR